MSFSIFSTFKQDDYMEMKCPKCGAARAQEASECIGCGIIFEKYLKASLRKKSDIVMDSEESPEPVDYIDIARQLLFYVKPEPDRTFLIARAVFFLFMSFLGIRFISSSLTDEYLMNTFWHLVNLPFHEAGHIFFRLFGRFVTSLGGTLGQLLMPLICMGTFIIKTRDTFAASFCLWWFGQNFIDISPYINDARSLSMPLLGGNTGMDSPYGFHDWEFILKESGLIKYDHAIALLSLNTGKFLIILSLSWAGYILLKQYRNTAA